MARYYLTKTTAAPGALLEVGGSPVLSSHEALVRSIQGIADPASIGVLAEPVLSHGNDVAPATIVWYSSYPGEPRRLAELDPEQREPALSLLRSRLVDIAKGISDPAFGPLVGAALNALDPDDIYVVNGQPVLVGWGMVPPEANVSTAARQRHFAQTMARHLPLAEAPPVNPQEWRSQQGTAPPPTPEPTEGATTGVPREAIATGAGAGGGPPPPGAAPPEGKRGGWHWAPLVLLLLVSIAALVWLLMPGTRLMPPEPPLALLEDDEALRIVRAANAALEDRARQIEEAIAGAMCTADGELVLPDGRTAEGILPSPAPRDEPAVAEGRPDALVPPPADRIEAPEDSRAGEAETAMENPATLLELIEGRTALVLTGSGMGSGFFVAPELLVTNAHVIEDAAAGDQILVINRHLGRPLEVEVLARDGPLEETGGDYALLRVPGADSPFFTIRDSTETMKLQNVIAAGYPGVLLDTDPNFGRLRAGDAAAIPELTVTDGIVNVEHELDFGSGARAIIHSARISSGNSGGPLVDVCGRLVGVNTFVRSDKRTSQVIHYSLASADLLRFLEGADVQSQRSADPCTPRVRPAEPPPPAAPRNEAA